MNNNTIASAFAGFAVLGAFSVGSFNLYSSKPELKNYQLVQNSAGKLSSTVFDITWGSYTALTKDALVIPLDYTLTNLETVKDANPTRAKELGALIAEVEAVKNSEETLNDLKSYKHSVTGIESDLDRYLVSFRTNSDSILVGAGYLFGGLSLVSLGFGGYGSIQRIAENARARHDDNRFRNHDDNDLNDPGGR
jgi:hypothetical protein